ncbi:GntR family transcriptional regulator [Oscillatoria laete-virens NRMC-F 0139]|jgi:DNA-binding GntR family transcriptional regulator|nr:GntR family transcriptional regulator [Oscillatoria laete-virens]MDL5054591.1 GntR family transcriptional regulator [Oscillatoria laete-virens NRMC-F 0139]
MNVPKNVIEKPSLGQIQNKSLREHVLEMLHTAIVNGELRPGQTLVEAELAAQLGVSRAPLREAINILNAEGLVEIVPYHGTTVKKLARKDIEELYSIRSLMEGFAVQRIIESDQTPEVVTKLREICSAMLEAADAGDMREVNLIDRHFHDTLVASSQNSLLVMLWGTVSLRVRQVMSLRNRSKGDLHEIARNHNVIVDAIESEDTELAVQLIHHHIGTTGDLIAEGWEEGGSGQNNMNNAGSKERPNS